MARFGWLKVPAALALDPTAPAGTVKLWAVLYSQSQGLIVTARPGAIAELAGMSARSLRRHREALIDMGYLEVTPGGALRLLGLTSPAPKATQPATAEHVPPHLRGAIAR